jgi:hypothetical protein
VDSLAYIHRTRLFYVVVLSGELYPRVALDATLTNAQALASRHDASASGK